MTEQAFTDANGRTVTAGTRIEYLGGSWGTVQTVFQDGEVAVRFDRQDYDTLVKWRTVCALPENMFDPKPGWLRDQLERDAEPRCPHCNKVL